jgi:hypothetical protein
MVSDGMIHSTKISDQMIVTLVHDLNLMNGHLLNKFVDEPKNGFG